MPFQCFLVTATGLHRRWMRRFKHLGSDGLRCTSPLKMGYHDAQVFLDDIPAAKDRGDKPTTEQLADPRWPFECACGYRFADRDEWQIFTNPLYSDGKGNLWPIRELPPGAMYAAPWANSRNTNGWKGDAIQVVLPDSREWCITGPSSNGGGWTVTGTMPCITASPSIHVPGYHGFLRDGVLTDDIDGRTYPNGIRDLGKA